FTPDVPVPFHFLKCRVQFEVESGFDHFQKVEARVAQHRREKRADVADKLDDIEIRVDHDACRRIPVQQNLVGNTLKVQGGRGRVNRTLDGSGDLLVGSVLG